jgi:hypothetical protein
MKKLIAVAALVVFPMVASAKGTAGWTTLGKNDKFMRTLIAKELTARNLGRYTMISIKGEKQALGGNPIYGSQTLVKFTAQPRIKVKVGGKTRWMKLGGVTGECKYGSIMCQPPAISSLTITARLRSFLP